MIDENLTVLNWNGQVVKVIYKKEARQLFCSRLIWIRLPFLQPKSSTEVTKCTSSNILVWFGRDAPEKSVAGLRESLFLVLLQNLQKD